MTVTPVFTWNANAKHRIVINQGGSSSSKTYSIVQVLILKAIQQAGKVITITAQDYPNMRKGVLRDFERIMSEPALNAQLTGFNKTNNTAHYKSGSIIEFVIFKDEQDAKSGKRDYLFINECDGITFPVYQALAMRTRVQIFLDYNPTRQFWVHENLLGREDVIIFYSTWRNNPFLEKSIIAEIEQYKTIDENYYKVFSLGRTGVLTGQIFPNWKRIETFTATKNLVIGLDFGFTNSPTAIVKLGEESGAIQGHEICYRRQMSNQDIIEVLKDANPYRDITIIADSAEPKSIAEIKAAGFKVLGAEKIEVKEGINLMKKWRWEITEDSTNWEHERKNYIWAKDKDGRDLNVPLKAFDHCFDAARYAFLFQWHGKKLIRVL